MIRSYLESTVIFPMYIRFSGTRALYDSLSTRFPSVHWMYSSMRCSQFEHFRAVVMGSSHTEIARAEWILFVDADDLVSPVRNERFEQIIIYKAEPETPAILFGSYADQKSLDDSGAAWPTTWSQSLACGKPVDVDRMTPVPMYKCEIWKFAIRGSVVRQFFQQCQPTVLAEPFCDLYFIRFVCSNGDNDAEMKMAHTFTHEPLYFWRYSNKLSHASKWYHPSNFQDELCSSILCSIKMHAFRNKKADFKEEVKKFYQGEQESKFLSQIQWEVFPMSFPLMAELARARLGPLKENQVQAMHKCIRECLDLAEMYPRIETGRASDV